MLIMRDHFGLAKVAYLAYGEAVDFRNVRGEPMPAFADLGELVQSAWVSSAEAVARVVLRSSPDGDEL